MTSTLQPQPAIPQHLQPHQMLRPGDHVHVNHHARWLPATVTRVGARTVGVRYENPAVAAPLADAVLPWAVRPADGAQLRAATSVTAGDRIIFGSRVRTLAAPPVDDRTGWLQLSFTDGGQNALVMPGAVLRLVDDTPKVTVNGQALTALFPSTAGWRRA